MTLASCALEGTAARFQNSSPSARCAVVTAAALRSRPGPLARPSRLGNPRSPLDEPSCSRVSIKLHWDGTEQAPGTRNTARATTREHAEPRSSASTTRALCLPDPGPRWRGRSKSPRRRPRTQGRPCVPPHARAPRFSLGSELRAALGESGAGAPGRGRGRRPPQ